MLKISIHQAGAQRLTLVLLFLALILCDDYAMISKKFNATIALSAAAAILSQWLGMMQAFTLLKPLTTILIIGGYAHYREQYAYQPAMVVIALIACLGGDVLLLDESLFAYGLSSFLLAQLIFAYLFYSLHAQPLRYPPLLLLGIFCSGFYWLMFDQLGNLAIPVAVYQVCISLMCWMAISLYLNRRDSHSRSLAIAALLFVFSDSIIAFNKFLVPFELSGAVILSSYWLSIAIFANVFTKLRSESQQAANSA